MPRKNSNEIDFPEFKEIPHASKKDEALDDLIEENTKLKKTINNICFGVWLLFLIMASLLSLCFAKNGFAVFGILFVFLVVLTWLGAHFNVEKISIICDRLWALIDKYTQEWLASQNNG